MLSVSGMHLLYFDCYSCLTATGNNPCTYIHFEVGKQGQNKNCTLFAFSWIISLFFMGCEPSGFQQQSIFGEGMFSHGQNIHKTPHDVEQIQVWDHICKYQFMYKCVIKSLKPSPKQWHLVINHRKKWNSSLANWKPESLKGVQLQRMWSKDSQQRKSRMHSGLYRQVKTAII